MTATRLDWVAPAQREHVSVEEMRSHDEVVHYSIPNYDMFGGGATESPNHIESAKLRVRGDELLVSRLNPRKPRVLLTSKHDVLAVCSGEFVVLRPGAGCVPRFLYWRLLANDTTQHLAARVQSVTRSQQRVPTDIVRKLWLDLPSTHEQERIAKFLDVETARIDALLCEQGHMQQLLRERRATHLSDVTGARVGGAPSGLDRALKSLPRGWTLVPLRAVATVHSGLTLGRPPVGKVEERPYLRVANVQDGSLDLGSVATVKVPPAVALRCELRLGDVLMTEGGDNDKLGRGTVWHEEIPGCLHQNHVFAVRPDRARLRPDYLAAITASSWGRAYFTATAHQTTNLATTNKAKVGRLPLPLPPIDVQDACLDRLEEGSAELDALDRELDAQAELLQEHRQALITHAVTHGIDGLPGAA